MYVRTCLSEDSLSSFYLKFDQLSTASTPFQHPFNTLQHPFNTLSTPFQHPFNNLSTSFQHPFNTTSTPLAHLQIATRFDEFLSAAEFGRLGGVYNGMRDVVQASKLPMTSLKVCAYLCIIYLWFPGELLDM